MYYRTDIITSTLLCSNIRYVAEMHVAYRQDDNRSIITGPLFKRKAEAVAYAVGYLEAAITFLKEQLERAGIDAYFSYISNKATDDDGCVYIWFNYTLPNGKHIIYTAVTYEEEEER